MIGVRTRSNKGANFSRRRRQVGPGRGASWPQALIFNALLLIAPILGARIVADAFAEQGFGDAPTAQAISQTRTAIDNAFADMVAVSGDPDAVWAEKVDEQVRAGRMEAARGFLIAGPEMMSRERAISLEAAAQEEPSGSEDERLARAALIFLPDAVRARYERQQRPTLRVARASDIAVESEIAVDPAEATPADGTSGAAPASDELADGSVAASKLEDGRPELELSIRRPPERNTFDLIGDSVDLANRLARWLAGEQTDVNVLRLRGFAQIAADAVTRNEGASAPFNQDDLALGVSVIAAGKRAGRLHPAFARTINSRLDGALPEAELRAAVEVALAQVATSEVRAERVREAFLSVAQTGGIRRLALELELVSGIAERASPSTAMDLIQFARGRDDLRRLRVITEAGGDRAAALAATMGEDILGLATSGARWSRNLYLQVMALAAVGMALIWSMLSALNASVFHDNRKVHFDS